MTATTTATHIDHVIVGPQLANHVGINQTDISRTGAPSDNTCDHVLRRAGARSRCGAANDHLGLYRSNGIMHFDKV